MSRALEPKCQRHQLPIEWVRENGEIRPTCEKCEAERALTRTAAEKFNARQVRDDRSPPNARDA